MQKVQEIYLDIMNREMARKPITFPVTTACFSIDENNEIQDDDFLKFISEKNADIVDIKFAVSTSMYADEQIYCFSALILYK